MSPEDKSQSPGEVQRIRDRYERRKACHDEAQRSSPFIRGVVDEREQCYRRVVGSWREDLSGVRMLEIGAGEGHNLAFFNSLGIPWSNIWANELLEDRVAQLRSAMPDDLNIITGDATKSKIAETFDLTLVSTVFSSILDPEFRRLLANRILETTKPGGLILFYDFVFKNPWNRDVSGVKKSEIRELFCDAASIKLHRVTLLPPLGRRIGNFYSIANKMLFFLRTHVVAAIIR